MDRLVHAADDLPAASITAAVQASVPSGPPMSRVRREGSSMVRSRSPNMFVVQITSNSRSRQTPAIRFSTVMRATRFGGARSILLIPTAVSAVQIAEHGRPFQEAKRAAHRQLILMHRKRDDLGGRERHFGVGGHRVHLGLA